MPTHTDTDEVLLRKKRVLEMTGLSQTGLHVRIKSGIFPRPVSLGGGRSVAFLRSEVLAYIAARRAERDADASALKRRSYAEEVRS